jgi:uncharacterized protein (TIGR02058 family)
MAQGIDLHGGDDLKAACRAVEQALQGASLPIFETLDMPRELMRVVVRIGVPRPDAVDLNTISALLPYGVVQVIVEKGGLDVLILDEVAVMAAAALEVFLPLD